MGITLDKELELIVYELRKCLKYSDSVIRDLLFIELILDIHHIEHFFSKDLEKIL